MTVNGSAPKRILIAETEGRSIYEPLLRSEGFETQVVSTGAVAMREILEGHWDLAVLDEDLPDRTGLDILRLLGKSRHVPVILCSHAFNVLHAVEAMRVGAWDYLPRATPKKDLLRAVTAAFQQQASPLPARIEQRKRQAQKMELFGRLASGVIHDFNNLLTVVSGYTELLKGQPLTPAGIDHIQEMEKAVKNGAGLTHQLLNFARNRAIEPRPLDLNSVLCKLETMLARLLGESIRINLNLGNGLGAICADANQIEQVILNLAVNARDAMPDGGQLTFETANIDVTAPDNGTRADAQRLAPGPFVILRVADTGYGMDDATKAHLFEPFFTTKAEGQGTGLGLTTVFSIVASTGGHIGVASQAGQGTTFTLTFPRLADDRTSREPVVPALEIVQPLPC